MKGWQEDWGRSEDSPELDTFVVEEVDAKLPVGIRTKKWFEKVSSNLKENFKNLHYLDDGAANWPKKNVIDGAYFGDVMRKVNHEKTSTKNLYPGGIKVPGNHFFRKHVSPLQKRIDDTDLTPRLFRTS